MHNFLQTRFVHAYPVYSISSLNDIKNCIYRNHNASTVYKGAQAHIVGLTNRSVHSSVYDWLAQRVYDYLNNGEIETKASFDDWHDNTCTGFINQCHAVDIDAEYGMAQKFVNLTLKYVYCFNDSTTVHTSKFKFCHIALDGFTYNGYGARYITATIYGGYTINTPFYSGQVYPAIVGPIPRGHRWTAWSRLTREEYIEIQNNFRNYFNANPLKYGHVRALDIHGLAAHVNPLYQLTPFESEFFIWM